MPASPDELFRYLTDLGITTATHHHPPLRTVQESKRLRGALAGGHAKNLYLRDHKKRNWLVVLAEDREVDLKALAGEIGAGRLSFGSPDRLLQYLGVVPGAVTPFAVVNDAEGAVTVALDRALLAHSPLNFHPLDNSMTTQISPAELVAFLEATGHRPQLFDL
jgi:Ala-tRNA(Pro) deacylase